MKSNDLNQLEITKDGEIYRDGEKVKPYKHHKGYLQIWHKKKNTYVHRLVAEEYIPNPDNKPQVNHKNGNKEDNRVENLEWVTNAENWEHSKKNGLWYNGYNEKRKLSWEQAQQIRTLRKTTKMTYKQLSHIFEVSTSTIKDIVKYKKYTSKNYYGRM